MKESSIKTLKLKKEDGTIAFSCNGKLHNWDGPALIHPNGEEEYYLNGIKKTKDEWKEAIKNKTGLPYYKQTGFKARF